MYKRVFFHSVALMVLTWVSLNFSLFGISDRIDKYLQDLLNTHAASLIYPTYAHPDITVLLLTDRAIQSEQSGRWPARYDFHARVLKKVLSHKPKAVFIDFLWLSQRLPAEDGTPIDGTFLLKILKAFKEENVPVYLAMNNAVEQNWPELMSQELIIPVAVPVPYTPADFIARRYPAQYSHPDYSNPESNSKESNKPIGKDNQPLALDTAAFRLARDITQDQLLAETTRTMEIFWGTAPNPDNLAWMTTAHDTPLTLQSVFLRGYERVESTIPYHRTIYVRDILNPVSPENRAHEETDHYLKGKIVLYGAQLQGVSDLIFTPTRNLYAGIYFHAMALDNLLRWGTRYKSEEQSAKSSALITHVWLILLTVLPVAMAAAIVHCWRHDKRKARHLLQKKFDSLLTWAREHPIKNKLVISTALLIWFGFWAWYEFYILDYAASLPAAYFQLVLIGFFAEKTGMIDWLYNKSTAIARHFLR